MSKPKFDPNKPYQAAGKPAFDPNKEYQVASGDNTESYGTSPTMPPWMLDETYGWGDGSRAIVKNLAADNSAATRFLKQKYPGVSIREVDGELQLKMPTDKAWYKLDPGFMDTITNPIKNLEEPIRDVMDLFGDVGVGTAQAAGKFGGGLAGLQVAGPVGAYAGAAAGGGLASAGAEYGRQALGEAVGIPDNINHMNAAVSGVAGALDPLLFGVPVKTMVGDSVAKGAIPKTAEWIRNRKGISGTGLAALVSRTPRETIEAYDKDRAAIDSMTSGEALNLAGEFGQRVRDTAYDGVQSAGKAIDKRLRETNKTIDLKPAIQNVNAYIAKLESDSAPNDSTKALLGYVRSLRDEFLDMKKTIEVAPTQEALDRADLLWKHFDQIASNPPGKVAPARISDIVKQSANAQKWSQPTSVSPGQFVLDEAQNATTLNHAASLRQGEDALASALNDKNSKAHTDKLGSILEEIVSLRKPTPQQVPITEVNGPQAMTMVQRVKPFANTLAPDEQAAYQAEKRLAGDVIIKSVKQSIDDATGGMSDLNKGYRKALDFKELAESKFSDRQKAFDSLASYNARKNMELQAYEAELKAMGLGTEEIRRKIDAWITFKNPSYWPVSGGGTTSTSVSNTASDAGAAIARGAGVPEPVANLVRPGFVMGTSRGAVKKYLQAEAATQKALNEMNTRLGLNWIRPNLVKEASDKKLREQLSPLVDDSPYGF